MRPTLEDDALGVAAVYITPGGRWLAVMVNCRFVRAVVGILVVWDLWRGTRVLKRSFPRPVHFANIRQDDKCSGLEVIAGFEKIRNE